MAIPINDVSKDSSQIAADVNSTDQNTATNLITRLRAINPGMNDSKEYQKLCADILEFVFSPCFSGIKIDEEVWDEYGTERIDLIFPNNYVATRSNSFWQTMLSSYKAESVLIECKNIKDFVGNFEIRQAISYDRKPAGKLRVIISRNGLDRNGWDRVWNRYIGYFELLILVLSDEDLIKMIEHRINGREPEQVLQDIKSKLTQRTYMK